LSADGFTDKKHLTKERGLAARRCCLRHGQPWDLLKPVEALP
jgi:hypothetical protein